MTKTLLDGPGRVLESVYPRFLVDLAQGDDARLPQAHQQQFRERLMQELLARVQLQTWTNGGMLNAPLSLRLTMVEKLASKYSNVEKEVTEADRAASGAAAKNGSPPALCFPGAPPANCRLV